MPTDADIAWAAGLFEGEGCFSIANAKGPDGRKRPQPVMTITMSDRDVLERFQAVVGIGNIHQLGTDKRWPTHKPLWKWIIQRRAEIERIGEAFRPWLGERRRARLAEILAARQTNDPLDCAYCGETFVPQRARKAPAYCSKTCSARSWAGVKNPRVKEYANG